MPRSIITVRPVIVAHEIPVVGRPEGSEEEYFDVLGDAMTHHTDVQMVVSGFNFGDDTFAATKDFVAEAGGRIMQETPGCLVIETERRFKVVLFFVNQPYFDGRI